MTWQRETWKNYTIVLIGVGKIVPNVYEIEWRMNEIGDEFRDNDSRFLIVYDCYWEMIIIVDEYK